MLLLASGCAAIQLTPGAEMVRIVIEEPDKDCKFLGEVTGSQGNMITGSWTSNATLETGARNDLKNKAWKMGGNVVLLLTQRAGQTTGQYGAGGQTNVTLQAMSSSVLTSSSS